MRARGTRTVTSYRKLPRTSTLRMCHCPIPELCALPSPQTRRPAPGEPVSLWRVAGSSGSLILSGRVVPKFTLNTSAQGALFYVQLRHLCCPRLSPSKGALLGRVGLGQWPSIADYLALLHCVCATDPYRSCALYRAPKPGARRQATQAHSGVSRVPPFFNLVRVQSLNCC